MLDVTAPDDVEIEIRADGAVLWVHVNGVTMLRACRIGQLRITDHREATPERFVWWPGDVDVPPSASSGR